MGLYDFPDEQPIARDLAGIRQTTLEVGVAFLDQRGLHLHTGSGGKPKFLELIDFFSRTITDAHHRVHKVGGRQVDYALLTPA